MTKILMILTSHRLDCFRLCMDLLVRGGSIRFFDRVVLLLNGVAGRHLRYVEALQTAHPEIPWDIIAGPRGRGWRISNLQNDCVRRHPGSLYFKIDEDTFVSADWPQKLLAAYEAHRDDPALSLITPVIPNNALGTFYLLHAFPELAEEYTRRFNQPLTPDFNGPVWFNPRIADWITRAFLDLREANDRLRRAGIPAVNEAGLAIPRGGPYGRFAFRFSINCLCYDYRHWQELGGIPEFDEIGWGDWIAAHRKYAVLVPDALVHHYSFFVQQDWLDRTPLLEDLRRAQLPDTLRWTDRGPARWGRIARQVPGAVGRRLRGRAK
ncbi:MAG: hypothetical protein KA248_01365 [Kiritimatiellae bacterium]|nr:hypothetical protein [Kiritimatiellia bacterium]